MYSNGKSFFKYFYKKIKATSIGIELDTEIHSWIIKINKRKLKNLQKDIGWKTLRKLFC